MSKIKRVSDKEVLEDMTAILKHTVDFERNIDMINLNEEELLIFKRAANQLRKTEPNMLILRKAYDIFVVKSFANSKSNHHDTQAILGEHVRQGFLRSLFKSTLAKLIFGVILLLILLNFLNK